MQLRDGCLLSACAVLGFAATLAVDSVASDCQNTYSPDPPYVFVLSYYPGIEPEGATTGEGDRVEDRVPYTLDAWIPPLVPDPASWRLEGTLSDDTGEDRVVVLALAEAR